MTSSIDQKILIADPAKRTNSQEFSKANLQQSIRSHIRARNAVPIIVSDKLPELIQMERLVKDVFMLIRFKNPFVLNNVSPDDFSSFIESQAKAYLECFGLNLCQEVANPMLKMHYMPFTAKSTFFDFYDLCKARKERYQQDEKLKNSPKQSINIDKRQSVREMLMKAFIKT